MQALRPAPGVGCLRSDEGVVPIELGRPSRWRRLAGRQNQAQSSQNRALPRLCARHLRARRSLHLSSLRTQGAGHRQRIRRHPRQEGREHRSLPRLPPWPVCARPVQVRSRRRQQHPAQ
ncbi:MAG: hypothetical protein ACK55Z_20220, partial [bacterium]